MTAIAAGSNHSLAPTADGTITGWGYNGYGQRDVPDSLTGKRVTAVAASGAHSLALTDDGTVTAWGWDQYGQATVPASLAGKRVTAIAAGNDYSLAPATANLITTRTDPLRRGAPVSGPAHPPVSSAGPGQNPLAEQGHVDQVGGLARCLPGERRRQQRTARGSPGPRTARRPCSAERHPELTDL
ncbi:hypothetical protein ACN28C_22385 [Plantactinospora sp. WMMC1484]|uniref:hypothetical protein n=1 Tax=Plantactinospora sp. WMMC1484 TaxID=3404122 RepID=UPI003BF59CCB